MQVRGTLIRGGTSKCWIFGQQDVPADRRELEEMLIGAYDAPDARQIDGVGGATSTTSKAAVVTRSDDASEVDVDYLFAQVGIGERRVEWGSNCGNCATAIGLYAVKAGLVRAAGEQTRVRMRNINTGARLDALVDTPRGRLPSRATAGVPGTEALGVPVELIFVPPFGDGAHLPTGQPIDHLQIADRVLRVTMINAGAPLALVAAEDLGLTGTESLSCLDDAIAVLTQVRRRAALAMGLIGPGDAEQFAVPKVGLIGRRDPLGRLPVRMLSMHDWHPAVGLTTAVGLAVAGSLAGTVVAGPVGSGSHVELLTPSGVLTVAATRLADGSLDEVRLHRAARVIADAVIYLPAAA